MSLFQFVKSKTFFKHLILSVVVTVGLAVIILKFLKIYTHHNEFFTVPDLTGKIYTELEGSDMNENFEFVVTDSLHDLDKPKGSVIAQDPYPGAKVKRNRTIYLTVVAMLPEKVAMPGLIDLSQRQAVDMLTTCGLQAAPFEYRESEYKNAVLDQLFRGARIEPGTMINKGSAITLVLGKDRKELENLNKEENTQE